MSEHIGHEGPEPVDEVTRRVVTDAVSRYRGIALGVAALLVLVVSAPTRSPEVVPFASDFSETTPAVSTDATTPIVDPGPSAESASTTTAPTTTTSSTTTTTASTTTTTSVTTTSALTTTTTTSSTTTPTTTTTTPPAPLCDPLGVGCP